MIYKSRNYYRWIFLLLLFTSCTKLSVKVNPPLDLIIGEGFKNPIGFYNNEPTFSWKLPVSENIKSQSAYRIVAASKPDLLPDNADLWDTEKVNSNQSAWVKYNGLPLYSRQEVYWRVMYWDQDGKSSNWSDISKFELGFLTNDEWEAKWISVQPEHEIDEHTVYKPQYLRNNFKISEDVEKARLYITSKGVFEAQINGKKVGKDVLTPGWTPYKKRIETLTYDVSQLLRDGENALGVIVGQGWYWGRINHFNKRWSKKPYPAVICQLEITYRNGKKQTILSDSNWKASSKGPIRFSGIYDGEVYDANMEISGWSTPEFNDELWKNVKISEIDKDIQLQAKRHNPVRDNEILTVVNISEPKPGKVIFDLGQNMVGVAEVKIPVKRNQKVAIRFAEMLQQNGKLYTKNYRTAISSDFYIPKEDGVITYRPKFTFHGFRYVELSGYDTSTRPQNNWVKGIVQYSDFEKTGYFNSSNKKLNQLQSNINWGLKGNFLDIPTDCPQRDERMGWTGDAQVFTPTSIFNSDVHSFWASWLQSMREEQLSDGGIPIVIPSNRSYYPSAGWSDAATVIPWQVYMRTGDKRILEENYQMMLNWVKYNQTVLSSEDLKLKPLGDWLQPFSNNPIDNKMGETSIELIETAYFAHSISLTLNAAKVLGKESESKQLKSLRDSVRLSFEERFINEDGTLNTTFETQTGYLMALGFELVSDEMAEKIVTHLIRKIKDADKHLRTGFLGTPLLAPVLQKYGLSDLMYTILFKETYPSWFYSINQGGTTIWERWNSYSHKEGFGDAKMNSFNHYAYGAVGQWMYESIGGISPLEPGYKKVLIAPVPGKQLEFANAEYNSVYGKIYSGWKKIENGLQLEVVIPPNTTAKVVIPFEKGMSLLLNEEEFTKSSAVISFERNEDNIALEIVPGSYLFKTIEN